MKKKFGEFQKTDQTKPKLRPELLHGQGSVAEGSETEVFETALKYKEGRIVHGLVYKKIRRSEADRIFGELEMDDILRKYNYIKRIKRDLVRGNQKGFNIPGTIRGYKDDSGAGILMTDLSERGKKEVFDFKDGRKFVGIMSFEEWKKIKEAILRDIDIAIANNLDLCGSPYPLDPWLIIYDRESGHFEPYIVDIGGYVHIYKPPKIIGSKTVFDLLNKHREAAIYNLNRLEGDLKQ